MIFTEREAVTIAVKRGGGATEVAKRMTEHGADVNCHQIADWMFRDEVPAEQVWSFCFATNSLPWLIRPDVYSTPSAYKFRASELVHKIRKSAIKQLAKETSHESRN